MRDLQYWLPRLGHRNWIVVADAAFPDMVAPGVEVVLGADLGAVVEALHHASHVRADVFLDTELDHLDEDSAPGVEAFLAELRALMPAESCVRRPHEEILGMLDEAARQYRVVVFKTDRTVPYTSVFFRLECGYWGEEAEKSLRARINSTLS